MNVLEKILKEIDREIYKQREICNEVLDTPGYRLYEKTMNVAKEIVKRHMDDAKDENIHSNDGWIPVEDRLPEDREEVEVTIEEKANKVGKIRRYTKRAWLQDGRWIIRQNPYEPRVIAWQPLPEPYKPKKATAGMEHIMSRFMKAW